MGGKESKHCQYEVVVKTIDKMFAGTDDNVFLTLIGPNGKRSKIFDLDVKYKDDFEEGERNTFELEDFHDFGPVEKIEVTLKRTVIGALCGRKDYWGLEWILVIDKIDRKIYEFPVNRWLVSGDTRRFSKYDTCLPQHDTEIEQRKRELVAKRDIYKFKEVFSGVTPLAEKLPFEEEFTESYNRTLKELLIENSMIAKLISFTDRPFTSLEDIEDVYKFCYKKPQAVTYWRSDSAFGRHQLTGANPINIRLCTKIPENFGVTAEMVTASLGKNSPQKAMQEKRLFISDYGFLENICGIHAPVCLYYLNDAEDLVPIAIQLRHLKSATNPVFVPSDPEYTWMLAKLWFNVVDSNYQALCVHLSFTHYILETIAIAINRHLSPSHPLFRLVKPHITHVMSINWTSRKLLLDPESGFFEKIYKVGAANAEKMIIKGLSSWSFTKNGMLPNDLKERGLYDQKVLPKYYYRDDAMLYWEAIREYVYKVAEHFYDNHDAIEHDTELHLFRHTLTKSVATGGCGLKDVPGDDKAGITTLEQIVEIFTTIIFMSSVYHAAVNFPTYEQCAFPPNFPVGLRGSLPTNKKPRTELDVVRTLPTKDETLEIMNLVRVQNTFKTSSLGEFDVQYMYHPKCVEALKKFRAKLKTIGETIDHRNRLRTIPYTTLHPDKIPNSVAI